MASLRAVWLGYLTGVYAADLARSALELHRGLARIRSDRRALRTWRRIAAARITIHVLGAPMLECALADLGAHTLRDGLAIDWPEHEPVVSLRLSRAA